MTPMTDPRTDEQLVRDLIGEAEARIAERPTEPCPECAADDPKGGAAYGCPTCIASLSPQQIADRLGAGPEAREEITAAFGFDPDLLPEQSEFQRHEERVKANWRRLIPILEDREASAAGFDDNTEEDSDG